MRQREYGWDRRRFSFSIFSLFLFSARFFFRHPPQHGYFLFRCQLYPWMLFTNRNVFSCRPSSFTRAAPLPLRDAFAFYRLFTVLHDAFSLEPAVYVRVWQSARTKRLHELLLLLRRCREKRERGMPLLLYIYKRHIDDMFCIVPSLLSTKLTMEKNQRERHSRA